MNPQSWTPGGPFHFDMLTHPWVLYLLIGVLVLLALELASRPHGALRISTGDVLARLQHRGRSILRHAPAILRAVGLAFLIIALARPLNAMRPRVERVEVIDIILIVDVSGSMTAEDFVADGKRRDRLWVTKAAVQDFLETRKLRTGDRFGIDRIGLVFFAAYAWMQCPLTLDYGIIEKELTGYVIDRNDERSNRTAIGSALGLAISRLNKSEAKSKVIILLTDGINNFGNLDPVTAAQIAKEFGIRVYTIGAGSPEGAHVTRNTLLGPIIAGRTDPIDEETMKRIADLTGGKYYRATDFDSLRNAYREINELETTEIEIGDVYEYQDAFVPYALIGAAAITASIFGRRRWFESIP